VERHPAPALRIANGRRGGPAAGNGRFA
jgi:hypothetical protein